MTAWMATQLGQPYCHEDHRRHDRQHGVGEEHASPSGIRITNAPSTSACFIPMLVWFGRSYVARDCCLNLNFLSE